jgi:hypothetical protein
MKKAVVLTISLTLILILSGINLFTGTVYGQVPHFFPDALTISIFENLTNSTVYALNSEIPIQFTVTKDIGSSFTYALYPNNGWFLYNIDNSQNITSNPSVISRNVITVTSHHGGPTQHEITHYSVSIDLQGLPEGKHKLSVFIGTAAFFPDGGLYTPCGYRSFAPLFFFVGGLPSIEVASPENTTYNENIIPLSFVTEHVSQITYNIDGQDNVTISGNTTISSLSNGLHNITFCASDTFGNFGSPETINFTVAIAESKSFLDVLVVVVSVAVLALVAAGLLVYHKKHKKDLVNKV